MREVFMACVEKSTVVATLTTLALGAGAAKLGMMAVTAGIAGTTLAAVGFALAAVALVVLAVGVICTGIKIKMKAAEPLNFCTSVFVFCTVLKSPSMMFSSIGYVFCCCKKNNERASSETE